MIKTLLDLVQPLAVIIFLVGGILSLLAGKHHQGVINLCFALANFMVFYGNRFLK